MNKEEYIELRIAYEGIIKKCFELKKDFYFLYHPSINPYVYLGMNQCNILKKYYEASFGTNVFDTDSHTLLNLQIKTVKQCDYIAVGLVIEAEFENKNLLEEK